MVGNHDSPVSVLDLVIGCTVPEPKNQAGLPLVHLRLEPTLKQGGWQIGNRMAGS